MPKTITKKEIKPKHSEKTYLEWFRLMHLIRKFEEKAGQLYIQQKIRGFCHLYIGQEALVAGCVSAINKSDNLITAYRDHAHPLGKGLHPKYVMAELYGKATGSTKGKGGSMHIFDVKNRLFGGHAIVGAQIPLGAGIAFAEKYKKTKAVTLCFMGDGAVRQGALHETFNMAMTWKLPVIFIIENNNYAMGTSVERTSNVTDLYKLGAAYDMPSFPVDGMRCESVHEAVIEAAKRARSGNGPTLLEMVTYRYKGHSMSDPASYRSKEEVEEYKARDCIEHVLAVIKKYKFANAKELDAIRKIVKSQIDEAVKFAEESPYPDLDELYKDVYMQEDYPYIIE